MPSFGTMLRRGLAGRCPACGSRDLFVSRFRLRDTCPSCGLVCKSEAGHELGGITMNLALTLTLMLGLLLFFAVITWPAIPVTPMVLMTLAIAVVVPVAFWSRSKTVWLAIEHKAKELP